MVDIAALMRGLTVSPLKPQWVFEELVGAATITDYLRRKMRTVRAHGINEPNSHVRVEFGRTAPGSGGRPCAFMTQGRRNTIQAAVLLVVSEGGSDSL
jgi:hypothetical protein